jgi:RNA polymerase sigma-70 factor (ECF subfamily)
MNETPPPDPALLSRVRAGDPQAFADLYDRYSSLVFGYSLRLIRDRALAEDVTQEVFLTLFRRGTSYDSSRPFVPWLLTLVKNKTIDFLRRSKGRAEQALEPGQWEGVGMPVRKQQVTDAIEKALEELPATFREAVWLADGMGIAYVEIATILGCDVGTVGSRVSRARRLLKDYFARNSNAL